MTSPRITAAILGIACCCFLAGCATNPNNPDPYEKTNRYFYNSNMRFDRKFFKPVSDFYLKTVPRPIRQGLSNAFDNLGYGDVILNDFLQGLWKQGLADSGRMAMNSTFGIAGIFDIASQRGLKSYDNDFGVTLGKWGFAQGPYLMLPLFGPSTARDVPDLAVSMVTNPLFWIDTPFAASFGLDVSGAIDTRSRNEGMFKFVNAAAVDPYIFTREAYLAYRNHLIHPEAPTTESDNMYDEPPTPPPTTQP